jgi:hypothetical protein
MPLKKFFFYQTIEKMLLYFSMIFDLYSTNVIILKFRSELFCLKCHYRIRSYFHSCVLSLWFSLFFPFLLMPRCRHIGKYMYSYIYEWRAHSLYRLRKKIHKNKFNDRKKLSVVFDRVMSNMYENTIFPTLPCDMVRIHNITS